MTTQTDGQADVPTGTLTDMPTGKTGWHADALAGTHTVTHTQMPTGTLTYGWTMRRTGTARKAMTDASKAWTEASTSTAKAWQADARTHRRTHRLGDGLTSGLTGRLTDELTD